MKPETKLLILIPALFVLRVIEQAAPDASARNAIVIGALLIGVLVAVGSVYRTAIRRAIRREVTR